MASLNVVDEYIKLTSDEVNSYMKLIFDNQYLKRISDEYIKEYVQIKFYNFYERDENLSPKKNYIAAIKKAEKKILEKYPDDQKLIQNMALFYDYIFYFDKMSTRIDTTQSIIELEKLRFKILRKSSEDFESNFYETYQKFLNLKAQFIFKFNSNDFGLNLNNFGNIPELYMVKFKYKLEFPEIYSEKAVEKTYNSEIVKEDRLQVEYSLLSIEAIKDIEKANFNKKYFVEFQTSLFKKAKKLEGILNIINNPVAQDKINLLIKYDDYSKNTNEIIDLLKKGFRFAIIIDNSMPVDYSTISKLNIFSYILVNKRFIRYDELMKQKVILNNLIEIK